MKSTTTYEPFDSDDRDTDFVFFETAKDSLVRIYKSLTRFIENVATAHGAANLANAKREYDSLFDIFSQDESPFSHHMMNRLMEQFGIFSSHHHRLVNNDNVTPTFDMGRHMNTSLQGIKSMIEELEMCIEWASSNEPTEVEGYHRVSVTVFTGNGNEEKSIDGAVTNLYDDGSFDMLSDDGEAYHVDLSGDVVTGNGSKYPLALYQPRGE